MLGPTNQPLQKQIRWMRHKANYEIDCAVNIYNAGTPQAFEHATPSDRQIRKALGIGPRVKIDTDGDDLTIYVNRERDGYPLGELHCVSHESLSPVRKRAEEA